MPRDTLHDPTPLRRQATPGAATPEAHAIARMLASHLGAVYTRADVRAVPAAALRRCVSRPLTAARCVWVATHMPDDAPEGLALLRTANFVDLDLLVAEIAQVAVSGPVPGGTHGAPLTLAAPSMAPISSAQGHRIGEIVRWRLRTAPSGPRGLPMQA